MECPFVVGQKVVCVDDVPMDDETTINVRIVGDLDGLRRGQTYTVREIMICPTWGIPLVLVEEIKRPLSFIHGVSFESGYDPARFRPLVERGTEYGMSILRDLLNKTDKTVEEVA